MSMRNYSVDGFTKADMAGKLIIKVQLADDIRCIPIHNEDITYDELVLMMQRVYQGRLNSTDEVTIKYRDEDGDLVTIFDNSDLSFAIHCSRVLKITLFVNGQPKPLEADDVKLMRTELQSIRNRVNHLLDCLNRSSMSSPPSISELEDSPTTGGKADGPSVSSNQYQGGSLPPSAVHPPVLAGSGKEFDPLSSQKPASGPPSLNRAVNSVDAGGQNFARSNTPDSVNSLGAASSGSAVTYQSSTGQGQGQGYTQHGGGGSQSIPQGGELYTQQQTSQGQNYIPQQGQQQQQADYALQQQQRSAYTQQQQQQQQQLPAVRPGFIQQNAQAAQPVQTGYGQQQQPVQGAYSHEHQPVQTGFQQQQVRTSYPQQQQLQQQQQQTPGYVQSNQPIAAPQPVYNQSSYGAGVPGAPTQSSLPSANPYSRGPSYGQYPRAQGQYPQAQ